MKKSDINNKLSIKEQLQSSMNLLENMSIVVKVSYSVFKNKTKEEVHRIISDYFKRIGYEIERQNFGIIVIDEKRINESLNYVTTQDEISTYLSLPKVLKQGIIIGMHRNHKGRNVETVTIAAPVDIDGKKSYVAAVIKRTSKNFYKVHRVQNADAEVMNMQKR